MQIKFKQNLSFSLVTVLFLSIFIFISQTKGQEVKPQSDAQEISTVGTRIIILTSGPAKFTSFWLDAPPRLVVEFQSGNILSKMGDEVIVERGGIKKIISTYIGKRQNKSLQSLTFELSEKVSYKIWQEENAIVLDIQIPSGVTLFTIGTEGIVESTEGETEDMIIKRLEAMDTALAQAAKSQRPAGEAITPSDYPEEGVEAEVLQEISFGEVIAPKAKIIPITEPEAMPAVGKEKAIERVSARFWPGFAWLIVISGLGFWVWYLWYKRKPSIDEKIRKLKLELQEKDSRFKHEEAIRKAVEKASLEKEEAYKKLNRELQEMDSRLRQTEGILEEEKRQTSEKEDERKRVELELKGKNSELKEAQALHESARMAVLEKEEECKKLKDSYDSLEDIMIKKALVKKMKSPEGKETLWIHGKSQEKRAFPRLSLTKDFNKSIVVRIEPRNQPHIRCFVNNISSGGLCFGSPKEFFKEKEAVNLRMFFYGDKIPMIKAQARIIWKRTVGEIHYYGVSFELLKEEGKLEFDRYVETNIAEKAMVEV